MSAVSASAPKQAVNTDFAKFETQIRKLSERIAKAPNDRQPIQAALQAIKNDFSALLATDNKAISSYNIVASSCEVAQLPRVVSGRVTEELKQIKSPEDAKAVLEALEEGVESKSSTESATDAVPKKQGWGNWLWGLLPAFVKAIALRVTGWAPEEIQEFREGLKKIADSK